MNTSHSLRALTWLAFAVLISINAEKAVHAVVPPVPSTPLASCISSGSYCYAAGSFTLTTSSAGAHHYRFCRSNDTLGWGGCSVTMTWNAPATYTVTAADLPSDGYRRAYYAGACDAADNCTNWAPFPAYVTRDATGPGAPGPTTTNCVNQTGGLPGCWTTGPFQISVTPASDSGSGVDPSRYWICRSVNSSGGFAGCDVTITNNGTTSTPISDLPPDGFQRAYYFQAKDRVGNFGAWNTPIYVRIDSHPPTVSASNSSTSWFTSQTATISAGDTVGGAAANSGLKAVRYRWNTALDAGCTNGTVTSNGSVLIVPNGDNILYLCAADYTNRVTQWNGPYRVTANYNLTPVALEPYTFGCAQFCSYCNNGFGYAYDPSVIERSGKVEIFVQGATEYCLSAAASDTIIEGNFVANGENWQGQRVAEVSAYHSGDNCDPNDLNPAAGPDVLFNSNTAKLEDRILFYSRGNADAYRGKVVAAYESNSSWILNDDKNILYPRCYETSATGTNTCTTFGVARVAALEVGSYYYFYMEIEIDSSKVNLTHPVPPFGLKSGIFLMRAPKSGTPPYVAFGTNQAQLYDAQTNSWNNLDFQTTPPYGYSTDFCNGNLVTTSNFDQKRLKVGGASLGDVTLLPNGEYLMTYLVLHSPLEEKVISYKRSTDPTFNTNVKSGTIDLSGPAFAGISSVYYPTILPRPLTGDYLLFFSNLVTTHGNSEVRAVRVVTTPIP